MNNRPMNLDQRQGVTLIETILVITVLATAAVAGGFFMNGQWHGRRGVTDATCEVAQTLRAARNTAIMNRTTVRVRRSRKSGHEILTIREDAGPIRAGNTRQIDLGTQLTLSGSPTEIRFSGTGDANRLLQWKMVSEKSAGTVTVAPFDGSVTTSLP